MATENNQWVADQYPCDSNHVNVEDIRVRNAIISIPGKDIRISDVKTMNGDVQACFYIASLNSGLRFPLHPFFVDVLNDFGIAPSQLTPNAWRILCAFYMGCRDTTLVPTSRLFRYFYNLKLRSAWYYFQAKDIKVVSNLPSNVKSWRDRYCIIRMEGGFGVDVNWRVALEGANEVQDLDDNERASIDIIYDLVIDGGIVNDEDLRTVYWPPPVSSSKSSSVSESESNNAPLSPDRSIPLNVQPISMATPSDSHVGEIKQETGESGLKDPLHHGLEEEMKEAMIELCHRRRDQVPPGLSGSPTCGRRTGVTVCLGTAGHGRGTASELGRQCHILRSDDQSCTQVLGDRESSDIQGHEQMGVQQLSNQCRAHSSGQSHAFTFSEGTNATSGKISGEKRPAPESDSLEMGPPMTLPRVVNPGASSNEGGQDFVLTPPLFGAEVPFVKDCPCPASTSTSLLSNPQYAIHFGRSFVPLCDRQYILGSNLWTNLDTIQADMAQMLSRFTGFGDQVHATMTCAKRDMKQLFDDKDVAENALAKAHEEKTAAEIAKVEAVAQVESLRAEHDKALAVLKESLEAVIAEERSRHSEAVRKLENQLSEERSKRLEVERQLEAQIAGEKKRQDEAVQEALKAAHNEVMDEAYKIRVMYRSSAIFLIKERYPSLDLRGINFECLRDEGFVGESSGGVPDGGEVIPIRPGSQTMAGDQTDISEGEQVPGDQQSLDAPSA